MTFGQGSLSRSLSRTALVLKKQLWIWPIIAIVVLSILGHAVRSAIERTMRESLTSELRTLLSVEVAMLDNWVRSQESNAATLANDARIRSLVYGLLRQAGDDAAPAAAAGEAAPPASPDEVARELRRLLGPALASQDYSGYFVVNRRQQTLAGSEEEDVGRTAARELHDFLTRANDGETVVVPPFHGGSARDPETGERQFDVPTMFVCAPVRDESFQVVAVLGLRIRPEREFTRIMQLGQLGESGETYAFNSEGVMVSNSRFDSDLILLGILPDVPEARSILSLPLRDPGQDITTEGRPRLRRADMPLTRMAESSIAGQSGVDVDGYRDYRGVTVVGAWTWLEHLKLGIATEIDHAEAFQPLRILQTAFWALYGLLTTAAVAIFVFTLIVARLRREAQKAAIEAKELGQYHLQDKLGAGAMGVVYRGYHSMLRRPTAIKMLNVDRVNDDSIKRFEHEVQITCQLNHPNTIAIYDYGRTPEGVFYYAMEYLDGIDLQKLVEQYGPLPESRVAHILNQICGSLYEAHSKGLVHRDIKPANIMLNRRGGDADVVKVLDFGLVKAIDSKHQQLASASNGLTGTPLYMSPEAIQSPMLVDACSDLYAVGGVAYFLLTGQPVFNAASIVQLLEQHVNEPPVAPSKRLGRPIS
ncbi:MAG: serine/threonine protein kinase, partial [Planctomycetaceae bacterium]|nr:serine/threonine protein kinase [Planctomycetaceae bacterium]